LEILRHIGCASRVVAGHGGGGVATGAQASSSGCVSSVSRVSVVVVVALTGRGPLFVGR
jgi:hypothetical protein